MEQASRAAGGKRRAYPHQLQYYSEVYVAKVWRRHCAGHETDNSHAAQTKEWNTLPTTVFAI